MTHRSRFAFAALLVALPFAAAAGPKQAAKAHIAKAMKAHEDGKYDVALAELQTAYKLDPQLDLLFAIGQVHVKLGNCDEARAFYDKFLAGTKDPAAKPVVTQALEACKPAQPEPKVEAKPEPVPEPEPPKPEPPKPEPPKPEPPKPVAGRADSPFGDNRRSDKPAGGTAWYKDPIGDALVVGGTAALVVAGVMYSGARADLDDAEAAPSLADYQDKVDSAHGKRTTSLLLAGGGAALVGVGVIRYKLHTGKKTSAGVGMVPARGGGFVTWMGRF